MAEYKGIKGFKVQTVSTDPAASIIATGTWASGGTMNNPYEAKGGDGGTSSAAFAAGGVLPTYYNTTHEQYNGTTWTTSTGMNTSRAFGGAGGTTTAAFVATGRTGPTSVTANTELWNGTAWTEVNDVNTGRFGTGGGLGTQTAGLLAPGSQVPTVIDSVESWDGTNWTAVTTYPGSAHEGIIQFGTNTSAIYAGGYGGPGPRGGDTLYKDAVFEWNGSTFSAETNLPTIRGNAAGVGTTTDGLISGGWEGSIPTGGTVANTTYYDGTTWTELNNLATAAQGLGSSKSGTTSDTIVFGGSNALTEEWTTAPAPSFQQENLGQVFYNSTSNAFKVTQQSVPSGTWSSGGNLNTARKDLMAFGDGANNGIGAGGYGGAAPNLTSVESYNGTNWTEITEINNGRGWSQMGAGTQTAGLIAGGQTLPGPYIAFTETWNGTSWTEVNDLNSARAAITGSGTQTAAIGGGGTNNPGSPVPATATASETWDGTNWTSGPSMNTARTSDSLASKGAPSTDSISAFNSSTEYWNGTSWTEIAELSTPRNSGTGAGASSSSVLVYGGYTTTNVANTEFYNGTSWTEVNDLSTARAELSSSGASSSNALAFGGETTVYLANTEEWNVPTTNSTLTAS